MMSLEEASARYERAHAELTAAAQELRRVVRSAMGAPPADPGALIIEIVAKHFDLSTQDLIGARRTSGLVAPRQIAMVIVRRLTKRSLERVGAQFGGRDHGTVIWAEKSVAARCQTEPAFRRDFDALLARCDAEITKEAAA